MPVKLNTLDIAAPGFYGLNKQQSSTSLPRGWSLEANNCVIDSSGRVAARKGHLKVTTTPLAGTPDIESMHEYLDATGAVEIVSAANSKLYTGTVTLTEKTGSLTITDDNWKFQNFNGSVIGVQDSHNPIHYDGTGNFTLLHDEIPDWQAATAYALGDVVKSTSGNETIYFHCTTAGTTDGSEPTWDTTVGNTTADNSATWTTRQFPDGDECLSAFGRVWIVDSTKSVIYYSDLLIGYKFSGGSAGSIDLKSVWVYGMDEIIALSAFNGHLVIFGKKSIVVYSGPDDPDNMSLVEQVDGIGCIARDTVHDIGTDLWFLSDTGLRGFNRTIQEKSMPVGDISKNVRDYFRSFYSSEDKSLIRSGYHDVEGFYIINLPTNGITFCFDTRARLEDGSARVTTWDMVSPTAICSARDGTLYFGKEGYVSKYDGYRDNESTYIMTYKSSWNDFGDSSIIKIPKRMSYLFLGGTNYTITSTLGFDYSDSAVEEQKTLNNSSTSEWGIFEWGEGEWSGGSSYENVSFMPRKSGYVIQYGFKLTVNAAAVSLQKINLLVKTGKLA